MGGRLLKRQEMLGGGTFLRWGVIRSLFTAFIKILDSLVPFLGT